MEIFEMNLCMNGSKRNCFNLACVVQLLVCSGLTASTEVNQLSEYFVMEKLESGRERKWHDFRVGESHLWYLKIFPPSGKNLSYGV